MSLHSKSFTTGPLRMMVWDFSEVGDVMPMHRHDKDGSHVSVITCGKLRVRVTGQDDMIVEQNRVIDWPIGTEHEWECIDAPARIVNVWK